MESKLCLACEKELQGRLDKKFCDVHCKSSYHYKKSLDEAPRFYNKVDNQHFTNFFMLTSRYKN